MVCMLSRYEAEAESAMVSARLAIGVGSPSNAEGSRLLGQSAGRRLSDGKRDGTGVAGGC